MEVGGVTSLVSNMRMDGDLGMIPDNVTGPYVLVTDIAPTTDNGTQSDSEADEHFEFVLYTIIVPILFGLTALLGAIGNSLVIYVILSKKKMRTVTNFLLLNLAFADLSFATICPPFTAYQMATNRWPFGDLVCKLMHYLLNVTAYVTVYTLVLISVIRYMTIVHNASTIRLRTRRNIVIMIILIWAVVLTVNIPITLSYGVQLFPDGRLDCENFGIHVGQKLYSTFFVFAYVLPLTMVAVFSILILRHIKKQRSSMVAYRKKSDNKKRKASRLIILVVVVFAILWLPVHIHLLVAYFGEIPTTWFYQVISVFWNTLAYFNSCVNPFIYNYASKEFRDGFRDAVCCVRYSRMKLEDNTPASLVNRLDVETNGKEIHLLSEMKTGNTETAAAASAATDEDDDEEEDEHHREAASV